MTVSSKTALILLAEGFEEMEAIVPIAILRRAAIQVTIASITDNSWVKGKSGLIVQADTLLDEGLKRTYDVIIVPGGPGYKKLKADQRVLDLLKMQHQRQKWIAAICAAPVVLKEAGILGGQYTAHFSVESELPNIKKDQAVVEQGYIITARGAGSAIAFALSIVTRLVGQQVVRTIVHDIALL